MKTICLFAAVAATALVTGCSTTPRIDNVDSEKVAAINHVAGARGLEVHWVNYPQKKTPPAPGEVVQPTTTF